MKKSLMFIAAMVCAVCVFTGCSDDKDDPITIDNVVGTYAGKMTITMAGTEIAKDLPQNIIITKVGENDVKLEIKDFSLGESLNLGTITIAQCPLTRAGEGFTFTGAETLTLDMVGACDVRLSGNTNGKTLGADIDVAVTAMAMQVKVNFNGAK